MTAGAARDKRSGSAQRWPAVDADEAAARVLPADTLGMPLVNELVIGLPDKTGREAVLNIHSRGLPLASDVDIPSLARGTTGFSAWSTSCSKLASVMSRIPNQPTAGP